MGAKDIKQFQFKPGQSGNPQGRPKSRVPEQLEKVLGKSKFKKYEKLSKDEVRQWDEAIITMTVDQLKALMSWDGAPAYAQTLARAAVFDMKKGSTATIDKISERLFGKPTQRLEVTGAEGSALIPDKVYTKEQAAELMHEYERKYKQGTLADEETNTETAPASRIGFKTHNDEQ